ncbi:CDP-alcohol phosphatidyltransferase family protein [Psychrobacter sp. FDAARGOS_221]|uniref:CDP-alcohol phosphatidyltransferase family protein n=1 Tax=Psychrobacter sp. FDAARGOS_221 TaxID=1975705 RepID=UPI000BB5515D|nr:CDP-alcohol phosphatidyltransferase family protein [Psychrobacter sp. FDAARGOS_221]PNK59619.1 CDP-alcohol phosphatidyltransferase family protein [Psychrobacter sp. FDAARGOS_221]
MSVYQLKTQFQNTLRPISDNLVKKGVTANQVTVSAIILSAGTAYVIAHAQNDTNKWFILPLSLFIRMAFNAIDGMMAREHGQASKLGAVLNESGDIISDSLLINSLRPHVNSSQLSSSDSLHSHFNLFDRYTYQSWAFR